jgi:AcrR family transcriptional regulator
MDIATEAGMSKGAVHYHFPTKEALIGKVLQHACTVVAERAKIVWDENGDPLTQMREGLRELWRLRAARTDEALVVADLLAQSLHDEALRPQLADYFRFAANQLHEHVIKYILPFGIKPRVPSEMIPRLLNGLLDGLVMQHFVDPGVMSEEDLTKSLEVFATSLFEIP